MRTTCLALILNLAVLGSAAELPVGVRRVKVLNYPDCFELSNNSATRVTLCHQVGGRVLEYSFQGTNALYLDPSEIKWGTPGGPRSPSSAGRFDIGPEYLIPRRDKLWSGAWQAEAIGPRAVRLTSQVEESTGVQLIREFRLAANSTHLACTQIIRNVSPETKRWAHWSRTFAVHGGIGVVPLTPETQRFPNGFVMYDQGAEHSIILRPTDPNVRRRGQFLEVLGPTRQPKLGFDSNAGWFAYVMPHHQAFVKRYPSPPDGVYPEIAGLTLCFWYPKASQNPPANWSPTVRATLSRPAARLRSPRIGICCRTPSRLWAKTLTWKNSPPRWPMNSAEFTTPQLANSQLTVRRLRDVRPDALHFLPLHRIRQAFHLRLQTLDYLPLLDHDLIKHIAPPFEMRQACLRFEQPVLGAFCVHKSCFPSPVFIFIIRLCKLK